MENKYKYDPNMQWEQHIPESKPITLFDRILLFILRITSRMSREEMEQLQRDAQEGKLKKLRGGKDLGIFGKIIFLFIVFVPIVIFIFIVWFVGSYFYDLIRIV